MPITRVPLGIRAGDVFRSDVAEYVRSANGTYRELSASRELAAVTPAKPPCRYLGGQHAKSDGSLETIKCSCGGGESFKAVHLCEAPERGRTNGKPAKCVPGMTREWDADHQIEAASYQPCQFCQFYQPKETLP
jgi:hypothetical protein